MVISKNISKFYKKISIFTLFFNLSKIWRKTLPPLTRPWGTTLHKDLAIFLIIILDLEEAKSAKQSILKFLRIFRAKTERFP